MREKATTHGLCGTREYWVWSALVQRCTNPNDKDWLDYGGRGITICDRWRNDVTAFVEDMGWRPGPGNKWTVERLNTNEGYSPDNCVWADWSTQAYNRRPKGEGRKARGL